MAFIDGDAAPKTLLNPPSRPAGALSNVPWWQPVIETGHRPSLDDRCDYNRNVSQPLLHAVTE
jgi:hypothetical protein